MMSKSNSSYLGDALYADFDGYQIRLYTKNNGLGQDHEVFLEPKVMHEFFRYLEQIYSVKIDIKKIEKRKDGKQLKMDLSKL